MALKSDLIQAFKDNLENGGTTEDVAKLIVDAYKKSVSDGKDQYNNVANGILFDTIEKAIVSQFQLSFDTRQNLQFNLIEAGVVSSWVPAILKSPSNPPGFSSVITTNVITSIPPGIPPLSGLSKTEDPIALKFYDLFTKHSNTISFLYTGLSTSSPPTPTTTVSNSYTIK